MRESPINTGRPSATSDVESPNELEVLGSRLAEADPRIEADALLRDPGCDGESQALFEECRHFRDDVVIARVSLHRARLTLHVHQTEIRAALCHDGGQPDVSPQRRDVVDELGTELDRPTGNLALGRVDRDGNAVELLENRNDPAKLLVDRNPCGAGPRGLAADVHDRGPFLEHPARGCNRGVRVEVHTAVRKAVGRHVDDPHHRRALQTFLHRWTSHPAMEVSSRGRNALLTALGVLVALAVVAIASRGSIPAGEGGTRAPKQALIDIIFTLYLLTIASAAVLAIYLLVLRRQLEARGEVKRRGPFERLLALLVFFGIASLAARRSQA